MLWNSSGVVASERMTADPMASRRASVLRICSIGTSAVQKSFPEMRMFRKVCCINDFLPVFAGS